MRSRERKTGAVVIENLITISAGVTFKTCFAVVNITVHAPMLLIHVGLVVLVAVGAAELSKIIGIGVAVGAAFPLSFVFAGINREKLCIVVGKVCRSPVRT